MKVRGTKITYVVIAAVLTMFVVTGLAFAQSGDKVQISFYHRSHQLELEWAQIIIDRFHALHPEIEVSLVASGGGGGIDYTERLLVLQAGGVGPDVFTGYADKAGYMANGLAMDLAPFVDRDLAELEVDTFFPGVWDTFRRHGKHYGMPLNLTMQFVFYNQDIFSASGLPLLPVNWDDTEWTWDQLLAYAPLLTVQDADGVYQQLALTQATEMKLPDVSWAFGGDWFTPEAYETGIATQTTMNTPENLRAYGEIQALYQDYAAAGPAKGISTGSGFHEGRVAIDWIGAWRLNSFRDAIQAGGMPFSWAIAPVPLVENRANTRWTNPLYINSESKHPEAAWEFVKFATSTESQQLLTEMTSQMPARASAVESFLVSLEDMSGMSSRDLLEVISGAVTHSRPSIEELIADVPFEIARRTSELFSPMLNGDVNVGVGLIQAQDVLDGYIRGLGPRDPW